MAGTGTIPLTPDEEASDSVEAESRGVIKSVRCCVSLCDSGTEVRYRDVMLVSAGGASAVDAAALASIFRATGSLVPLT